MEKHIRNGVFEYVLAQPTAFTEKYSTGDILSRMLNDTPKIKVFFTGVALQFCFDTLAIVIAFSILIHRSQVLSLIVFAFAPLAIFAGAFFKVKIGAATRELQEKVDKYLSENQPVISVDAKKRELVGNFKNNGVEWHPSGESESVNAYDFLSEADGVAVPYGVYDIKENIGWVNVGITKDTAEFAVQAIRNWWYKMGIYYHNTAERLLITADGGGSNSSKGRLWKYELQKLANETCMSIEVVHFPPGTSKWNKIEHRLFSYISKNWRGKPLVTYQIIVNLIAGTKTKKGLKGACEIDNNKYQTGIEISDEQFATINISPSVFHGEWNYSILPE